MWGLVCSLSVCSFLRHLCSAWYRHAGEFWKVVHTQLTPCSTSWLTCVKGTPRYEKVIWSSSLSASASGSEPKLHFRTAAPASLQPPQVVAGKCL